MKYNLKETLLSAALNIITFGYAGMVSRATHAEQVNTFCNPIRTASYKAFKAKFDTVNWRVQKEYESLFSDNATEFHASIIQFEGVGFILSTYGFWKAERLMKLTCSKLKESARKITTLPHLF